jgi:hypothetical protein
MAEGARPMLIGFAKRLKRRALASPASSPKALFPSRSNSWTGRRSKSARPIAQAGYPLDVERF